MKKRFLSLLLTLCMVLSFMPTSAFAEGSAEEPPSCVCETACTAESMNTACPVCSEDGALPESCGQYAPADDGQTDEPDNDPAEADSDAVVQTTGAGETYDITADASENGTVKFTVNDEEVTKAAKDVEVTVVAVPEPGYKLTALTMNNQDILSEKKFTMPNEAAVVKATFTAKTYNVKAFPVGYHFANGGTVTVSEPRADAGDEITVTATPYEGWGLAVLRYEYDVLDGEAPSKIVPEMEIKPGAVEGSFEGTFEAPAGVVADVTVEAVFRRLVSVTGTVTSTVEGTPPIAGATVTLTWKEDNKTKYEATTGEDGTFTIKNVVDFHAYEYTVSAPNYYGTSGTVWAGVSSDDAAGTITLNASLAPKTDGTVTFDDPEDVTISYGETATKTASAGENDSRLVLYRSSNTAVATVDEKGAVTTTGVGDAIITAYCEESESYSYTEASYALQVTKAAQTALTWDGVESTPIPWNKPFTRTASGGTTEEAVKYESSDTDIAEVDASGVVTPVKPGNVTISAYRPGGTLYENTAEISYELKITKADQKLTFSQSSLNYTTGMSFDAPTLTVTQTKNETGAVTYSSDNSNVATVNSGTGEVFFTKTPGEVTITATKAADDYYEAAQASYTINVSEWNLDPQKTYYTLEGTQTDPSSGWYTGSVSLKAASGYELSYSKDGEWKETLSNAIDKDAAGEQTVSFYVRDEATGAISGVQSVSAKKDAVAPVINGADNGRTYCAAVTLTIIDENLASVTLNGEPVTLTQDDKLTVSPAEGRQTVVATDKAGNRTSITVTVNDGHTWGDWVSNGDNTHTRTCKFDAEHTEKANCHGGTATCKDRAVCDDCKQPYGELDPKNHTNLQHFPAKVATTTSEGNIEYWYCDGCGRYYSDRGATQEIQKADTAIARLKGNSQSPKTGNNSNLTLWIALLCVSGASAAATIVVSRKRKYNR